MEKPKRDFVYVDCWLGKYDFCHPNEDQAQFIFRNLPKGLRASYVLNSNYKDDIDWTNDALVVAKELQTIINKYLYNSSKEKIKEVIQWLEVNEKDQEKKYHLYRILEAEYYIEKYTKQLNQSKRVLEEV